FMPRKMNSSASSVKDHSSPSERAMIILALLSFLPVVRAALASAEIVGSPFLTDVSKAPAPSATKASGPSSRKEKSPSLEGGRAPLCSY
ncbi:MAG: hypothetical protein IJU61_14555, partial [Victivallales bacterium]|nr:hypothetical protein [Victivallales bacterium]